VGTARTGSHAVVILPDLHLPTHDRHALRVVLKACEKIKPRRIVILGDWIDAAFASGHPVSSREEAEVSGSRGGYIQNEIEPCRRLLAELETYAEEIIYLEGNHEFRVERLITREGGSWLAVPSLVLPRNLISKDRTKKFKWIPYQHNAAKGDNYSLPHYKIADGLIAVHGWSVAKNAAAKHLDMVRGYSIVHGHTHRAQSQTIRHPMTGRILKGWSPGCLSALQPMWMHTAPTEWVHGFSVVYCRDNLSAWTSYTVTIDRGKCILPDGTKVESSGGGKLYCEETIGS
jgi:UDP-2,3-diacylglucosamine pyrophosphatase LpxH